ncbi:MAG: prephenate/arogenate dehydrogenase family protein, partial [Devosiaceae bacterium]|nr:prephenate/arogenate dehydrogenase family protein [Devosiaceae bacterium]
MLEKFLGDLDELKSAVDRGDGDALEELFTRTRAIRRSIIEAGQEIDVPDFGREK